MSRNVIVGIAAAFGLYYLLSSDKGEWYFLNDKNEWIRFSVPINENIIETAYQSGEKTIVYSYPLNSDIRYKVYFNKKLEQGSDHSVWNEDLQTGELSKLKRL